MTQNNLTVRTARNALYSFLNYALPLVFTIVVTPLLVTRIGVEAYGIFVFALTVLGFMSLVDFGLSLALIKQVAAYDAQGQLAEVRQLIAAAKGVYWLLGVLGFGICVGIGFFLGRIFPEVQGATSVLFVWAGIAYCVNTGHTVESALPMALQRYDVAATVSMLQLVLFNVGLIVIVFMAPTANAAMVVYAVSMFCWVLACRYYARTLWPALTTPPSWQFSSLRSAYRFGLWAAVANAGFFGVMQLDRFLIPFFTGPRQLTFYALPGNITQKISGVVGSLGTVFFPLTSAVSADSDPSRMQGIYKRAMRNLTVVAAALSVSIIVFGNSILYYWLGPEFASQGRVVLYILVATYYVCALYSPLYNFLMGLGKVKFLALWSLGMAAGNIVLVCLLVPQFGIQGAAWAFLLSMLPIPAMFYYTEQRILRLSGMARFYALLYGKVMVTALVWALIAYFLLLPLVHSVWILVIVGPSAVLLYFGLYKLFGFFEDEDWQVVLHMTQNIVHRLTTILRTNWLARFAKRIRHRIVLGQWHWVAQGVPLSRPEKYAVLAAYADQQHLTHLIETGTYKGDTLATFADRFVQLYSIELDPVLYATAAQRFADKPHITVLEGDSAQLLPQLVTTVSGKCLFWLDGHYSTGVTARGGMDTPILQELGAIMDHASSGSVIVIDDARLFVGRHDYPTIGQLHDFIRTRKPAWQFSVQDDLIRILT